MTDSYFVVTDYGAVGDGVADDTAAMRSAAQAARRASIAAGTAHGVRGATLFFPRGQYRVSESLHFDATHGSRLVGEGSLGLSAAIGKTGTRNKTEAALAARRNGWLS